LQLSAFICAICVHLRSAVHNYIVVINVFVRDEPYNEHGRHLMHYKFKTSQSTRNGDPVTFDEDE